MAVLFVDGHRLFYVLSQLALHVRVTPVTRSCYARCTFVFRPLHVRVTLVARLCSARYTFVLRQLCQRISSRVSIIFT